MIVNHGPILLSGFFILREALDRVYDSTGALNTSTGGKMTKRERELTVTIMVEIPKGGRNKYEYDKENRRFKFDRMLFSAVHYPSDYGFILDTLAGDGDPLDALVLLWEPTFPGCIIEAKPVGVFKMRDEKGPDEKILCVPIHDPFWNHIETLSDVPPHLLKEISHFFSVYKDLELKKTDLEGWEGRGQAIKIIKQSQETFKASKKRKRRKK